MKKIILIIITIVSTSLIFADSSLTTEDTSNIHKEVAFQYSKNIEILELNYFKAENVLSQLEQSNFDKKELDIYRMKLNELRKKIDYQKSFETTTKESS